MSAQQKKYKLGSIEAAAGTKRHGFIKAGELPASDVLVPVYIINGAKPGPTLCVVAGVHPDEWQGMEAAVRVYNRVDPKKLSGTVISCPYQNLPGFQGNANIGDHGIGRPNLGSNPLDGTNLSKGYPGNDQGTISERIAHVIYNQLVLKADYVMDLHAGDTWEKIVPMSWYWTVGNEKVDKVSEAMARAYPTDFIVSSQAKTDGSLGIRDCLKKGIPYVLSESGSVGLLEESTVNFHFTGVLNVMKHFRMLQGNLEGVPNAQRIFEEVLSINATHGGFYTCEVEAGQNISKGQVVAEVKTIFGEPLEKLESPVDGSVFFYRTWPPVMSGDLLLRIVYRIREDRKNK
jgi:predicted deacylase